MTETAGSPLIATSSTEHGIAVEWVATFVVEADLGFLIGDHVTIVPVPWAGAMMGGRVQSYEGAAEGGGTFLDVRVDSAVGSGNFTSWEIIRFGGPDDWRFGGGRGDFYVDQPEAVRQIILTRLRLYRGEWFVDTSKGMPWYEAVLGKHTKQKIEPAVRSEILGTPGVTRIKTFDLTIEPNTRALSITAEIDTSFGPTVLEGVL